MHAAPGASAAISAYTVKGKSFRGQRAIAGDAVMAGQGRVDSELPDRASLQADIENLVGVGVVEDRAGSPGPRVMADAHRCGECLVDPFHHGERLGAATDELRRLGKLLRNEVPHRPMAVVDHDMGGTPATAPSMAALASAVMRRRKRWYSVATRGSCGWV